MRYIYVLLFFHALHGHAQKWDYQWIFGYDCNSGVEGFGLSMIDFNDGQVTVDFWNPSCYDMEAGSSFICDGNSGQLLFHTNGCYIWDADQVSLTTGTLIDDWRSQQYCPEIYSGYQSKIMLPDMEDEDVSYLVMKDNVISETFGTVVSTKLLLFRIENGEDGASVTDVRELLVADLQLGHLTAELNDTHDKWWLHVTEYETNVHHTFLVGGADTVVYTSIQQIGGVSGNYTWDVGQAVYSPDGTLFANSTETYGVMLYDFDNATGILSNYREIHYPGMEHARGLAFSPNGRFIYASTADTIFQIDLAATHEADRIYRVGYVWEQAPNGWPIATGYMTLGPDCRIYVSPGSTTRYIHVIHSPDEKGAACQFEKNAINTPTRVSHHLPNLPNYHYPRGCDSSIAWGIPTAVEDAAGTAGEVALFPNPAGAQINLQLSLGHTYQRVNIYSATGQEVRHEALPNGIQSYEIDIRTLPTGIYTVLLSGGGQPQSVRFVKQ